LVVVPPASAAARLPAFWSALAAAAIAFALSRAFGRPVVERLVTRAALGWSDAFFARWGGWAVLALGLVQDGDDDRNRVSHAVLWLLLTT
jgi:hypothetical protein